MLQDGNLRTWDAVMINASQPFGKLDRCNWYRYFGTASSRNVDCRNFESNLGLERKSPHKQCLLRVEMRDPQ